MKILGVIYVSVSSKHYLMTTYKCVRKARRAEEGLKSRQINHADISITGCLLLWNPRIWKTLLKAHFHQFIYDSFFILYDI